MKDQGSKKSSYNPANANGSMNSKNINVSRVNPSDRRSPAIKRAGTQNFPIQGFTERTAQNKTQNGNKKRKKKRLTNKQLISRIGIGFLSAILIVAVGLTLLYNYLFSGMKIDKPSEIYPTEALTNQPPVNKDITNILLLGVDARNPDNENGLSDSIIILTIDGVKGVIKMTSIMRDSFVYIPGRKNPEKINAANNFGGPELAMKTINNTLRLNIKKYMVVNFHSMAEIIDLAGGVTVEVTNKEKDHINKLLKEDYYSLATPLLLRSSGTLKLNGKQAVEYARIRKIDSDSERTRRQRTVLSAMFKSFKDVNPISKAQMIQKGLSLIKTNMKPNEITQLGLDILPKMSTEIEQLRLPIEGYYKVNSVGVWFMNCDYNGMIPKVYEFIYGKTQPFDLVPTIPFVTHIAKPTALANSNDPEDPIPTEIPTITEMISSSSSSDSSTYSSSSSDSNSSSASNSSTSSASNSQIPTLPQSNQTSQ